MKPTDSDLVPPHAIGDLLADHWQHESIDELYQAGCLFLSKGLPILPVRGKTPCNKSGHGRRGWQRMKCSEKNLLRGLMGACDPRPRGSINRTYREQVITCGSSSQPAIGLRMGRGSVIDVETDSRNERKAVRYLFMGCPKQRTPTFQSKRGVHQLFQFDDRLAVISQDVFTFTDPSGNSVQVRLGAGGAGAHSVIPPSPDRYFLPRLSFAELDFHFAALPDLVINRLQEHFEHPEPDTSNTDNTGVLVPSLSPPCSCVPPMTLEDCYQRSLPIEFRQRHSGIFQFVRLLQQLDQYRTVDPQTPAGERILYPLVADWHQRASSLILNGTIEETWADCKRGWFRVKHPITININQQRLKMAFKMSKREIVPGSVIGAVAQCHSPSLPKLIALCAVLQRMNGIEAFALDGRAVADVLRISKNTVYRNIATLIDHGILERSCRRQSPRTSRGRVYLSPWIRAAHITSTPAADTAAAA